VTSVSAWFNPSCSCRTRRERATIGVLGLGACSLVAMINSHPSCGIVRLVSTYLPTYYQILTNIVPLTSWAAVVSPAPCVSVFFDKLYKMLPYEQSRPCIMHPRAQATPEQ